MLVPARARAQFLAQLHTKGRLSSLRSGLAITHPVGSPLVDPLHHQPGSQKLTSSSSGGCRRGRDWSPSVWSKAEMQHRRLVDGYARLRKKSTGFGPEIPPFLKGERRSDE